MENRVGVSRKVIQTKKKRFSWKLLVMFLFFEFLFTAVSAPILIFYGPFNKVKKTIVGAAMTTKSHQYIATTFLSEKKINELLSTDKIDVIQQDNKGLEEIQLPNNHDNSIEQYDIQSSRFRGHLLVIKDPTRVKVGYSEKLGKEGQMTSQIAQSVGAVAAINGGGFSDESTDGAKWTGTGGLPTGILMSNGEMKYNDINNPDEKRDIMAITKEGRLLVGPHSVNEMKNLGVTDAISFGPALVVNGKGTIRSGDGGWGIAPRTAVGQKKDGSIIFLVIDGRQPPKSYGATLKDVQDIMLQYGAVNATNLDGGSSTTMVYNEEVLNNPCDPLGERAVPSIVYVAQ